MRNLNSCELQPSGAESKPLSKKVTSREHGSEASLLVLRDTSSDKRALVSENSMIVNVSKSESELSKSRGCEIAQTGQATPQGDDCEVDPELDKQLEIAAEELMRELHEECDRKERVRASSGGLPRSSEGRNENVKGGQIDNSDIAGMRVDNRYYLSVVLGGREYKALFDPGASLSLAGPRVAELDKDRLKEYNSVIRSVNGTVTPVIGVLDLMFDVNGKSKLISVKVVSELDHDLIFGMEFYKEFDIDARLARGTWRSNDGEWMPFQEKRRVRMRRFTLSVRVPAK